MGLYCNKQIELLEKLIDNWYDIRDTESFYKLYKNNGKFNDPYHYDGLCCLCKLDVLESSIVNEMFSSWQYWNGDDDYPVGGFDEYHDMKLVTENPKRLHLAVHCLRWLRERNIEEK